MYRCLETSDLMCLIFEELEFNNSALVNAALTCKIFLEPALSTLWRNGPTNLIDTLFRIIPNDVWVGQHELPEEQCFLVRM